MERLFSLRSAGAGRCCASRRVVLRLVMFCLGVAGSLALARTAAAVDYFWTLPSGAPFNTSPSWSPFDLVEGFIGPGGAADTVNFDLGIAPAQRYAMTDVAGTNDALLVHKDSIRLEIPDGPAAIDYALVRPTGAGESLLVGVGAGDVGDLVLAGQGAAALETQDVVIGAGPGSIGRLAASDLTWSAQAMTVGKQGAGSLDVKGGRFTVAQLSIGDSLASNIVTIGEGVEANTSVSLVVGASQIGRLVIQGSSLTSRGLAWVGNGASARGRAFVVGEGSVWNVQAFVVGANGFGEVQILEGGRVAGSAFQASIANAAGSTGSVVVDGAGSNWESPPMVVGRGGEGTLAIQNGGQVTSGFAAVGQDPGSEGVVTLSGAGARWEVSGELTVGQGGSGLLSILGGEVDVSSFLRTGPAGEVVLDGGKLTLRVLDEEALTGLNWQSGTLRIATPAGLSVAAGQVMGSHVLLTGQQRLEIDNLLEIADGARLFSDLPIQAGAAVVAAAGQMFVGGGTFGAGGLTNHGDVVFTQPGIVEGAILNSDGGAITALDDMTFNGPVSGSGGFFGAGRITFAGGLSPGASPGLVTAEGDVSLSGDAPLAIELGGLLRGAEYDAVDIGGVVKIDSVLAVELLDGFDPAPGDQFSILTAAGGIEGIFRSTQLPPLLGGKRWQIDYTDADVTLAVLPGFDADFDEDGDVDADDLLVWRDGFGTTADAMHTAGDANGNGVVDGADFLVWQRQLGSGVAPTMSAIPEPAGMALACLAGILLSAMPGIRLRAGRRGTC